MLHYWNVISILLLILIQSCNQNDKVEEYPNTPTSGVINVSADNSFQYIITPQIELFTSIYKNTKINYTFKGEQECINDLLNNKCKVIFIGRKLSDKELQLFKNKNLIIQQTPIAYSAIAIISQSFIEKGIEIDSLKKLLLDNSPYSIVFFKRDNGTTLYIKDSLLKGKNFGKNCFVLEDTSLFRKYIFEHPDAIGIIDYSMICDDDDKWTRNIKYTDEDTLIIPVRKNKHTPAYYPDQSNIATKNYPLVRTIYCIRRGDDFSLSAGLEAFVAGEKGQILFKKVGLVPYIDRERKIQINPY